MSETSDHMIKGKRIQDLEVLCEVRTCTPQTRVCEVVDLMNQERLGAIIVTEKAGNIVGIFTERDLLKNANQAEFLQQPIEVFMTKNPQCVKQKDKLFTAFAYMRVHHFRHLIVVDENELPIGIFSIRDAFYYLLDEIH